MRTPARGVFHARLPARTLMGSARSILGLATVLTAVTASAQTTTPGPAPADAAAGSDETVQLPTFTVGATLRDEPLLSVPIPIAVVSGDMMESAGLRDLSDLTGEMPSLTFRAGASNKDTSLLIRGVGTITTSPGVEPDVSTVVDGVVLARPGQATMQLVDLDHIEILRGPQGTLFGKNSSVGAINIVSKDPGESPHGYLDLSYYGGTGDEEVVHGGASGAIVPNKLLASVSFLYDQYSGNEQNIFLDKTVNSSRAWGVRTKFVYTPTPTLKATVIMSLIDTASVPTNEGPFVRAYNTAFPSGVTTPTSAAALAAIAPIVPTPNNLQVNSGLYGQVADVNDGASAQFDYTLGDFKVTSITAYQHWFNHQREDTGDVPTPEVGQTLSWDNGILMFDQYSEELRLTSPADKFVTFVAGLYFQEAIDTETYRRDIIQEPTAGSLVPNTGIAHYGTHGANYSTYGEATWHIAPRFRIITGLRLTRDTLDYYHQRTSTSAVAVPGINPALPIHSGSTGNDGLSGRAGLQFDLTKNTMLFTTYSRGYKGPAYNVFFNQTALQVLPLSPETSNDFEIGLKSLTWNNRVQFTLTAFDTQYHNYQANEATTVLGTPVTNLINAGSVSSKGFEGDVRARVTSQLTLFSTASRINAVIDEFNLAAGQPNYNGQPLPFAPRFKEDSGAEYKIPVLDKMDLSFATDYAYQTKQQFQITQTPDTIQQAYGIWNGSITLAKLSEGWRVSVLGKNLADTHYSTLLTEAAGMVWRTVPRDNNRYFGISVRKDF